MRAHTSHHLRINVTSSLRINVTSSYTYEAPATNCKRHRPIRHRMYTCPGPPPPLPPDTVRARCSPLSRRTPMYMHVCVCVFVCVCVYMYILYPHMCIHTHTHTHTHTHRHIYMCVAACVHGVVGVSDAVLMRAW